MKAWRRTKVGDKSPANTTPRRSHIIERAPGQPGDEPAAFLQDPSASSQLQGLPPEAVTPKWARTPRPVALRRGRRVME